MDEFENLRSVAWMDACGQPGLLLDHEHAGRPFVFAGLEECQFSSTLTAMDNTMYGCISTGSTLLNERHNWMGQMVGGRVTFLQSGKMEQQQSRQVKRHHYQILWETKWVAVGSDAPQVTQSVSLTRSELCPSDLSQHLGGSPQVQYHSIRIH